jgi:hemolysin III
MSKPGRIRAYSRAEYLSDAAVHVTGIGAALVGGPVLVALAAIWTGDANLTLAIGIYAAAMLAMLVCSALYNMIPRPDWADRLRRLDQSAIYLKIAGTYTPFIALSAGHTGLLAIIWGGAVAGASIIILSMRRRLGLAIGLYLGLGWACVVWGWPMLAALTGVGFWLLVGGGLLYSAGVVFLLWSRLPHHNTIWHVFVLAATALCYAAIMVELAAAT